MTTAASPTWRWRLRSAKRPISIFATDAGAPPAAGLEGVTVWLAGGAVSTVIGARRRRKLDRLTETRALRALLPAAPTPRRLTARWWATAVEIDDLVKFGVCRGRPGATALPTRQTLSWCSRFSNRVDRDAARRCMKLTEGWPLGLQLALSGDGRRRRPTRPAGGHLHPRRRHRATPRSPWSTCCWPAWTRPDVDFLTRIVILDPCTGPVPRAVEPKTPKRSSRAWCALPPVFTQRRVRQTSCLSLMSYPAPALRRPASRAGSCAANARAGSIAARALEAAARHAGRQLLVITYGDL